MEEDLSWAIVGGVIVWLLFKKPCPCEGQKQGIAAGEPTSGASSSGGGCPNGFPSCG